MKAYRIEGCRVVGGTIWNGRVIVDDKETITEALRKKHGVEKMYCEEYPNEETVKVYGVPYALKEIPLEKVYCSDVTVYEMVKMIKEFSKQN